MVEYKSLQTSRRIGDGRHFLTVVDAVAFSRNTKLKSTRPLLILEINYRYTVDPNTFQDIPTFTSLKSHLLSLIRSNIKSTFGIHGALGLRYLFQLRVNLSPLRSHKRRHNISDTPSETSECNLGIDYIRHFLFECPFYAIQSDNSS